MELTRRPSEYRLPSYSLTSDLIGFLRCGLEYRYSRVGQLPSSRPVQMWFGQFIHGVLEEAYRRYDGSAKRGAPRLPPWPESDVEGIRALVKQRLKAQGLFPWTKQLEHIGDARALSAVNELGASLFPLIHRAEVRLTGSRPLPEIDKKYRYRVADRYEMVGVVDVITHVQLGEAGHNGNGFLERVLKTITPGSETFELILDYKGMRRPRSTDPRRRGPSLWDVYGWQVQTYAHLRSLQEDALPVAAGVVLYLNELHPNEEDLGLLKSDIRDGLTDVIPDPGSEAEKLLSTWREDRPVPTLPLDFRLRRAIRVVEVSPVTIAQSLKEFDSVVAQIETARGKELRSGRVIPSWEATGSDRASCAACDARYFCHKSGKYRRPPQLPGVKPKPATRRPS